MRKYLVCVSPLLSVLVLAAACSNEPAEAVWPGEGPPGLEAAVFARGMVSSPDHEHSRLEFSPDGSEMYWAVIPVDTSRRTHHGSPFDVPGQRVWYSVRTEKGWEVPKMLISGMERICSPVMRPSDGALFLCATPGSGIEGESGEVFRVPRPGTEDTGGPVIEAIEPLYEDGTRKMSSGFCFSLDGDIYFDLFTGDREAPEWTIYCSEYADGSYSDPVPLQGGINDGQVNWTPWLAPDASYLIFSSHREGNLGNGDLYISFRDGEGRWTEPRNMGERVNTSSQERFPSVSPDGRYLFFSRMADFETFSDIYWIDAAVIEEAREGARLSGEI